MSVLTIRMHEDKHERLRRLADARGVSMNRLIDELTTIALTQFDAETQFRVMSARGDRKRGLELLDKLDRELGTS